MLREFRAFVMRGNVLDLAVAVIIGGAFHSIVTSLTEDMIMPVIGALTGGLDFSSHFIRLGDIPANYSGPMSYEALKKAGVPLFGYGAFITAIVRFGILAFVIFWLIRVANRLMGSAMTGHSGPSSTDTLLMEIRDELKARPNL